MNKFYLVELIEYYYDGNAECIDQEHPEILGLYATESEYKSRIELEINNYKTVSKTDIEISKDDELVDGCIQVIDIVSKDSRVTIIVTEVAVGHFNKKIDYNRINYYVDYDKSGEFDEVTLEVN